jgi:putative membrane protein
MRRSTADLAGSTACQDAAMLVAIPAVLAALVHAYIFVIESLRFTTPSTMRVFGIGSIEDARTMRPWAFNQGFYNLFLAVIAVIGAVATVAATDDTTAHAIGRTLVWTAVSCMLAAAVVLVASDRSKVRAALVQGTFPFLTIVALLVT